MRLRHSMSCIACGLPLLTLAGCYSPNPYGSTGYPGYYSQPGGMGSPQMGPQSGPQMGPPTLVNPGPGGPPPGGGWQQPSQPTESFDPKGGSPTFNQDSGKVPGVPTGSILPSFQAPKQSPEDVPTFDEGPTPLRTPGNSGTSLPRDEFGRVATNVKTSGGDFQPPFEATPAKSTRPLAQLASTETSTGPSPFSFDGDQYRFLQGVVEFDAKDKAWHVMYGAEPDGHDKFGGDISLVDHPGLKGLHDQDVVYVKGRINRKHDSYGKPRYRIDHMRKLVPKRA